MQQNNFMPIIVLMAAPVPAPAAAPLQMQQQSMATPYYHTQQRQQQVVQQQQQTSMLPTPTMILPQQLPTAHPQIIVLMTNAQAMSIAHLQQQPAMVMKGGHVHSPTSAMAPSCLPHGECSVSTSSQSHKMMEMSHSHTSHMINMNNKGVNIKMSQSCTAACSAATQSSARSTPRPTIAPGSPSAQPHHHHLPVSDSSSEMMAGSNGKDTLPKDTIHGAGLAGVVGFLPYPSTSAEAYPTESTTVTATAPVPVLLRNLPWYALRFRHIQWLARTVCQTEIFSPDVTNRRCLAMFCVAYVPDEEKAQRLLDLNEKVLFDRTGVWIARSEDEKTALKAYCEALPAANGKARKYPRACATVDRYDPSHAAARAAVNTAGEEGEEEVAADADAEQEQMPALPTARDVNAPLQYKPLALPLMPARYLELERPE